MCSVKTVCSVCLCFCVFEYVRVCMYVCVRVRVRAHALEGRLMRSIGSVHVSNIYSMFAEKNESSFCTTTTNRVFSCLWPQ